ncbi:MAG: hypothetical protein HY529_05860 [Chloroflexi bacterium]|nr:hypothetical protein [Chloroflexota bacterium]
MAINRILERLDSLIAIGAKIISYTTSASNIMWPQNDIRNNADHGNFGQYDAGHVKDMLEGVQRFLSTYLV